VVGGYGWDYEIYHTLCGYGSVVYDDPAIESPEVRDGVAADVDCQRCMSEIAYQRGEAKPLSEDKKTELRVELESNLRYAWQWAVKEALYRTIHVKPPKDRAYIEELWRNRLPEGWVEKWLSGS
jgi:hypothetical protein